MQIGPLHVRRSLLIKAAPAQIWPHFESYPALNQWFGIGQTLHKFDPRVGGEVDLSVEVDGAQRHFGGRVLVYEGPRELTMELNWAPPHAWPAPTFFTIRLTPLYGGTLAEIFHHGFERLGASAADEFEGYETGWTVRHISKLRALVESA